MSLRRVCEANPQARRHPPTAALLRPIHGAYEHALSPLMVRPMREELTRIGVRELMNAEEVDRFMEESKDKTALLVVNSVCGCAAGSARPGVAIALESEQKPELVATVFAGQDLEATAKARSYFPDIPPSSPCMALFSKGELVHFVPRHHIEGRDAPTVAENLSQAFTEFCS